MGLSGKKKWVPPSKPALNQPTNLKFLFFFIFCPFFVVLPAAWSLRWFCFAFSLLFFPLFLGLIMWVGDQGGHMVVCWPELLTRISIVCINSFLPVLSVYGTAPAVPLSLNLPNSSSSGSKLPCSLGCQIATKESSVLTSLPPPLGPRV